MLGFSAFERLVHPDYGYMNLEYRSEPFALLTDTRRCYKHQLPMCETATHKLACRACFLLGKLAKVISA